MDDELPGRHLAKKRFYRQCGLLSCISSVVSLDPDLWGHLQFGVFEWCTCSDLDFKSCIPSSGVHGGRDKVLGKAVQHCLILYLDQSGCLF